MKKLCSFLMVIMLLFSLSACNNSTNDADLWENAVYTEDTKLGDGSKTLTVSVEAAEKEVVFTILTDATTLGEALSELKLISGEVGPYGLYVKVVNGITADYDIDKSFWSFEKNGEYLTTGVDQTKISNGDNFLIVRKTE